MGKSNINYSFLKHHYYLFLNFQLNIQKFEFYLLI